VISENLRRRLRRILATDDRHSNANSLSEAVLNELLKNMLSLTNRESQPNTARINELLRDLPAMRWNTKLFGHVLAKLLYEPGGDPVEAGSEPFELRWSATKSSDFSQKWFRWGCDELKIAPVLHRKVWELTYVLNCLKAAGKLSPGARGIGFGCGEEPLPSYLAARGISILATDLAPERAQASGWMSTNQHATDVARIHKKEFLPEAEFLSRVSLRYVDMNDIPADLEKSFDFCWSICALEHLGSIERGLKFIERSLDVLKPGGIAIHTTEFNYSQDEQTIDNWGTVLFRKKDFGALAQRLAAMGYRLPEISYDVGGAPVDWFIDIPPYPWQPGYYDKDFSGLHLKLMVDGFPCTCFGMVIQKNADGA